MLKQIVKSRLLPHGITPQRILTGPFKGIRLYLDLQLQSQMRLGLFEREVAAYLPTLCKDVQLCVDIGAYEGLYTIYFLLHTSARVIALDARFQNTFLENLKLNNCDLSRLTVMEKLLDDKNTLDDIIPNQSPALIKVDVDGAEALVLRGATRLLRSDVRWIVEYDYLETRSECATLLPNANQVRTPWWRKVLPDTRRPDYGWLVSYGKV